MSLLHKLKHEFSDEKNMDISISFAQTKVFRAKTLEFWISRSMLDLPFLLISTLIQS